MPLGTGPDATAAVDAQALVYIDDPFRFLIQWLCEFPARASAANLHFLLLLGFHHVFLLLACRLLNRKLGIKSPDPETSALGLQ